MMTFLIYEVHFPSRFLIAITDYCVHVLYQSNIQEVNFCEQENLIDCPYFQIKIVLTFIKIVHIPMTGEWPKQIDIF